MLGKSATRFLKAQYRNQTGIYKTIYLFTYLFIHSFICLFIFRTLYMLDINIYLWKTFFPIL